MITANFHRTHEVGHLVRTRTHGVCRIVRELPGGCLSTFPGGTGVRAVELVAVDDTRTTSELAYSDPTR